MTQKSTIPARRRPNKTTQVDCMASQEPTEWTRNPVDRAYIQERLDWMKAHINRTDLARIGDPDPRFSQTNIMLAQIRPIEKTIDQMLTKIDEDGNPELKRLISRGLAGIVKNFACLYALKPIEIRDRARVRSIQAQAKKKAGTVPLREAVLERWRANPDIQPRALRLELGDDQFFIRRHNLKFAQSDGRCKKLEAAVFEAARFLGKSS